MKTKFFERLLIPALFLTLLLSQNVTAQSFDSGSDGSDGDLILTSDHFYFFDPTTFDPPLDIDGDGIYHFNTIQILSGAVVDMTRTIGGPVIWLASGDVTIDGEIDLTGLVGHNAGDPIRPGLPGAGGFSGGNGLVKSPVVVLPQPGKGPGGGAVAPGGQSAGGGAGHYTEGVAGDNGEGGAAYGNAFLLPLIGGSGGAGGGTDENDPFDLWGGGGGGGGALLIASSGKIHFTHGGLINASGGRGGDGQYGAGENAGGGGGGSGGSIRLIASSISGNGDLMARGGQGGRGGGGWGAPGRIRLETFQHSRFHGDVVPFATFSTPGPVFLQPNQYPIRVVRIAGMNVPAPPTGGFNPADLVLSESEPITIEIEARGIPLGTVVTLTLVPETGTMMAVDSTPLAGSVALSTANATVTIPYGFSRFFIRTTWTP